MNKEITNKIVESYTGEMTDPNAVYELVYNEPLVDLSEEKRLIVPQDVVPEYLIYYLKCFNVDTVINRYIGYERYNRDGMTQDFYRYAVDFCRNGKKLVMDNKDAFYLDLYEGSPITRRMDSRNIMFNTEYNYITYFEPNWEEKWNVYFDNRTSSNYLRIELLLNKNPKKGKRIAFATDKIGNIEIFIDENARDFRRNHARKSGIKYTINIGKEHCDVNKYIDAIVSVINHDKREEAKLFEMIIRDPRVKEWLNEVLMKMPKSIGELYAKLKKEYEEKYQASLEELNEAIDKSQKGRHL